MVMHKLSSPEIWQNILLLLEKELSRPSFDTWFKSTHLHSFDGYYLTITVPNEFAKDWLETRYFALIKDKACQVIGTDVSLRFVIAGQENSQYKTKNDNRRTYNNFDEYGSNILNPKYVFETFVVGNSNRFAHAASLAVAEAIAKAYNPLFI